MSDLRSVARKLARLDFIDGLGVAIGASSVAMAHLQKRLARVTLGDFAVVPLPPASDATARRAALVGALREFGRKHAGAAERVAVSLPRDAALSAHLSVPAAAKGDLASVVEFEIGRLFPVAAEELGWDVLVHEAGERIEVDVLAVRRVVLADTVALLGEAGLRPHLLTLRPMVLLDLVHFLGESTDPTAFLVRDGTGVEIDATVNGRLRRSHALDSTDTGPGSRAAGLLATLTTESGSAGNLRIIELDAAGTNAGTAEGPGSAAPIEACRNLLARLGERLARPELAAEAPPAALLAIATALSAVREEATDFDLLPEEERRSLEEGAPVLTFFLAALLVLVTTVWLVAGIVRDLSVRSDLEAQLTELEPQVRTVRQNEQEVEDREQRLLILTGGDDRRASSYLMELSEIIPADAYLTSFRLRENRIELEGFAGSASDLIPAIEKSPRFGNPQFTSPVTKVQDNQERFALSVELPK